ncbi:hypothetical protein [Microcystis sp. M_QC_C_20170808_M9Col]|uniref:hypothetical protein n=1 Tax=Microcystis sp. M_QC_C_20170808_M9Col TaxID=2486217 RepID=UPI00257DBF8A|nr:hypothetical protein [Microcystis sp. M_QC_C_20170808_M9Col]
MWGVGCGVWGFTDFQVVNYLIFREKVPEFSPDLDLFSKPYINKKTAKKRGFAPLKIFSQPIKNLHQTIDNYQTQNCGKDN